MQQPWMYSREKSFGHLQFGENFRIPYEYLDDMGVWTQGIKIQQLGWLHYVVRMKENDLRERDIWNRDLQKSDLFAVADTNGISSVID